MRRVAADGVEVLGSPAYLMGFAAGDTLTVAADHTFEIAGRGPNLCVQVFADPPLTPEAIGGLRTELTAIDGVVESPGHRRFAVVTVPSAAGVARIGEVMNRWAAGAGRVEWQFGSTPA